MPVSSPLKWFGGKSYLAKRIVALMPPHVHYVEPYAGGLSVLLEKNSEGVSEVVNDLHKDLLNFWRVLQGGDSFASFARLCQATPFSEAEWLDADLEFKEWPEPCEEATDHVVRAWRFFILCRQSRAGSMKSFAPLSRRRTRRGMNEQASAWLSTVEGLPQVHARLMRVAVVGPEDALEVIRQQDGPDTLFYLDPPYLHETRSSDDDYEYEMSPAEHGLLLVTLGSIKGKFLLSGYNSQMYEDFAAMRRWVRYDFDLPNNVAGGEEKRRMTECVWANFGGSHAPV